MLTFKQRWMFSFIAKQQSEWISPTIVGMAYGKDYNSSSSCASPTLLRLVSQGLLERSEKGKYRLSQKGKYLYNIEYSNDTI